MSMFYVKTVNVTSQWSYGKLLLVEVTPREGRTKAGEADSIDEPLTALCGCNFSNNISYREQNSTCITNKKSPCILFEC